ncbi:hypothetical protein K3495_g14900 [Podosphaera aphanis]|nr:hypothetical protein K3495_g14900 [Podosphaera aphanis]
MWTHSHPCPAPCIHCHGPHAADAVECPLRPRRNGSKPTKEQIAQIRQSSAAARMSLCTTVGCICRPSRTSPEDHDMTGATSISNSEIPNQSLQPTDSMDFAPSSSNQLAVVPATYTSEQNFYMFAPQWTNLNITQRNLHEN